MKKILYVQGQDLLKLISADAAPAFECMLGNYCGISYSTGTILTRTSAEAQLLMLGIYVLVTADPSPFSYNQIDYYADYDSAETQAETDDTLGNLYIAGDALYEYKQVDDNTKKLVQVDVDEDFVCVSTTDTKYYIGHNNKVMPAMLALSGCLLETTDPNYDADTLLIGKQNLA